MNMTTLINLTPHNITIIGPTDLVIPSVGIARVQTSSEPVDNIFVCGRHVLVNGTTAGRVVTNGRLSDEGEWVESKDGDCTLPEIYKGNVAFIVSLAVASHPSIRGRKDVLVPGEQVRDDDGRVVGCRSLSRVL
jgi:hypothetical protein